ncbi:membrane protein UL120 [Panine betaherpesvirus 2]|uniref:Membrane protein UL120 n=1 Tax=Panine betaherpesvirus 2 TaxID=188763 RepID=Q8QRY9_9BETA|nr:membrane protein UL120 [Panine betaherpesvirus 2]AAM00749.1 membrane protein UL120 [Panine betaherpesvirus 2]QXV67863.1 membrane protein UL120 [Panine betaherpesvirus 2]
MQRVRVTVVLVSVAAALRYAVTAGGEAAVAQVHDRTGEPGVNISYLYKNDTNLTILCNTTALQSPFLASGIMVSTKRNTTIVAGKVNYTADNEKKDYHHYLNVTLRAEYGTYLNAGVTCWGSNGTWGAKTFEVHSMANQTDNATEISFHRVTEQELIDNPEYFRRSNKKLVMIVIVSQLVFVMLIINASFVWSWKFRRHR